MALAAAAQQALAGNYVVVGVVLGSGAGLLFEAVVELLGPSPKRTTPQPSPLGEHQGRSVLQEQLDTPHILFYYFFV